MCASCSSLHETEHVYVGGGATETEREGGLCLCFLRFFHIHPQQPPAAGESRARGASFLEPEQS